MASAGNGTGPHVAGELFNMMSGSNMIHVPYRGGPAALTAVLGGQVQVYFVAASSSIENIKAGKLRALAVTTATRWEGLPDVPALDEFLPGYEASIWFGIGAPKNTPEELIDKLNMEITAGLGDPRIKCATRCSRQHADANDARRVRQARRRRNRQMGQSHQVFRCESRMTFSHINIIFLDRL